MTTHSTTLQSERASPHRRGVPLGVVLLAILAGQALVIWVGYQFLHAF
jgi:hypothetical protein